MTHYLKILPCYFEAVADGRKTFEVRFDEDRGFQAGDEVVLEEVRHNVPTGRSLGRRIGYVTAFHQQPGWVVFSLLTAPERGRAAPACCPKEGS